MRKRICFLICPMRHENSETRKQSERFLKEIVSPVMEREGVLLRSFLETDDGRKPIREEMRNLLETADLCIADLTGGNPNVYFEYGVRRALGLPVLPMIHKRKDWFLTPTTTIHRPTTLAWRTRRRRGAVSKNSFATTVIFTPER